MLSLLWKEMMPDKEKFGMNFSKNMCFKIKVIKNFSNQSCDPIDFKFF